MALTQKTVSGYKFNTISAFNASNSLCNSHFGIPKTPESTTQNYIAPQISIKENGDLDFYYLEGDIPPVLGFPKEILIRIEE